MTTATKSGPLIGWLLLIQLAGLIVPFVLLHPLAGGTANALAGGAAAATQIKVAVALLFGNCALTIALSVVAFRALRPHGEGAALWLLVAGGIMFVLQAVDSVHILSLLSLSERYREAGGADGSFLALAAAVGSTRRWAHVMELVAIDGWVVIFYALMSRVPAVPRPLVVFGFVTVGLHFVGVPLSMFLDRSPNMPMAASMSLSHVALAAWLVTRGIDAGEDLRTSRESRK